MLTAVIGAALGLAGSFAVMLFLGLEANQVTIPFVARDTVLVLGLYSIAAGTAAIISGLGIFVVTSFAPRLYHRIIQ